VNLETKAITQITKGDHNYQSVALAGDKIIGSKMNMKVPTEIYAITNDGTETQLTFTNKTILDGITPAEFEKRWVETTDGKKELVWVIFPPNFDKTKKYPTLLYCQGGPQSAVSQFFSFRWNFQVMASNGYIIVAPNRRGLPTFGQEWNDQISGDYGGQNQLDYLSAIDAVAKEDYVDNDNLGAIGASYGGYSIYWLAGHHEGRFKAFISHCGIYDLESMYASTEETFFVHHDNGGAPWDEPQPKAYKNFSPSNFVGKWDTPILVITGGYDFRIPYTQSMQAFNAAQLHDIPSEFLFFPEETHFVLKPQNSLLWQREFKGFLDKYLKK
jgi:dipeptidyl aminopeptidase/acylaminoacyl peptidase